MVFKIAEALLTFESLTNDKLQKLCYFSYAWYLTFFGQKLFVQQFEAWEKGPVCPVLYEKYKIYEPKRIPRVRKRLEQVIPDAEIQEFLKVIYDAYGHLSPEQITREVCSEQPWIAALQRQGRGEQPVYDDEEIITCYTKKVLKELRRENGAVTKVFFVDI